MRLQNEGLKRIAFFAKDEQFSQILANKTSKPSLEIRKWLCWTITQDFLWAPTFYSIHVGDEV